MKRLLVGLAIIAMVCGQAAAQELPPEILVDQYLLEANRALEAGDPRKAMQTLGKIEALDTDELPPAYLLLHGKLLAEQGASTRANPCSDGTCSKSTETPGITTPRNWSRY